MSPPGLRHVTLSAGAFEPSLAFYDAALGALGLVRVQEFGDEEEKNAPLEAAGYGRTGQSPVFWLVSSTEASRNAHVAFEADSREQVDAFFAAAVGAGGSVQQAPRRWEIYRPGYYGALVADPDGNLVEAVLDESSNARLAAEGGAPTVGPGASGSSAAEGGAPTVGPGASNH